jgi:hypothetical protein
MFGASVSSSRSVEIIYSLYAVLKAGSLELKVWISDEWDYKAYDR